MSFLKTVVDNLKIRIEGETYFGTVTSKFIPESIDNFKKPLCRISIGDSEVLEVLEVNELYRIRQRIIFYLSDEVKAGEDVNTLIFDILSKFIDIISGRDFHDIHDSIIQLNLDSTLAPELTSDRVDIQINYDIIYLNNFSSFNNE